MHSYRPQALTFRISRSNEVIPIKKMVARGGRFVILRRKKPTARTIETRLVRHSSRRAAVVVVVAAVVIASVWNVMANPVMLPRIKAQ
jgi:hypothetical protein